MNIQKIKEYLTKRNVLIGLIILYLYVWGTASNEDICQTLSRDINREDSLSLDSIGEFVNRKLFASDSFVIGIGENMHTINISSYNHYGNDRFSFLVLKDTSATDAYVEPNLKEMKKGLLNMNDFREIQSLEKRLYRLVTPYRGITFYCQDKIAIFLFSSGAFGCSGEIKCRNSNRTKLLYIGKDAKDSICEFRKSNYPPWHLSKWAYELRPKWYILRNISAIEFLVHFDSMNISKKQ